MLLDLTLRQLHDKLGKHECTSVDLVEECYRNIEAHNKKVNALLTVLPKEKVLEIARKRDKERTKDSGLLFGLPFVLKDSYLTKGIRTTAASAVLKDYVGQYNATVYQKLLDAGAILIGKANMDAWGHGATSENNDFGPVKNPWDVTRSAGGSTGGCAAAIATRMAAFAIGEDTGGSIRVPCAWCNTTGLKVTYGRVSRYGCIAYASGFDTVGPMGKTVDDCTIILEVIAGNDPYDGTSSFAPVPAYAKHTQSLKGKVLGIPKELFGAKGLDIEIRDHVRAAADVFGKLGVTIKEISMPSLEYGIAAYYVIAPSETSSNLARYDGVRFGGDRSLFTEETMRRIMIGTYALSAGYYDAFYRKAQKVRTLFREEYKKAFATCDVLLMPVSPFSATRLGEVIDDPMQNVLADFFNTTHNPAGIPSLAVPAGFTRTGLPIGMQLSADMFAEPLLFAFGDAYQKVTTWHEKRATGI